jgi:thiol-disulfide isomerase/thioredoxin
MQSLYTNSDVAELTDQDFLIHGNKAKLKKKGNCIVKYYSPFCPHCVNKVESYSDLAREFSGHVYAVNTTDPETKKICTTLQIQGVPTFYISVDGDLEKLETGFDIPKIRQHLSKSQKGGRGGVVKHYDNIKYGGAGGKLRKKIKYFEEIPSYMDDNYAYEEDDFEEVEQKGGSPDRSFSRGFSMFTYSLNKSERQTNNKKTSKNEVNIGFKVDKWSCNIKGSYDANDNLIVSKFTITPKANAETKQRCMKMIKDKIGLKNNQIKF